MKKVIRYATTFALLGSLLFTSSCATIFTRASYPININSNPDNALVTITNHEGKVVFQGSTPTNVRLKASRGYMKSETYTISFNKDGYSTHNITLQSSLDGWYIGNILLGGLIGMLIVDPASGAMYRFKRSEREINANLSTLTATSELQILDINHLPQELKGEELVLL